MSPDEFNELPLLLKPGQVAALLGTTEAKLAQFHGPEFEPILTKGRHRRYKRTQLARLVGLQQGAAGTRSRPCT